MFRKSHLFFFIFLWASTSLLAQTKTVAILETYCADGNIPTAYLTIIGGCIETGLVNNNRYEAYNRTEIAAIIKEHNFQTSGLVDESEIRKLGVLSGVDYVLVTEATLLDSMIFVSAKALNVKTGEYDISENALMKCNSAAITEECTELAKRISQNERDTPTPTKTNEKAKQNTKETVKKTPKNTLFKPAFGVGADLATNTIYSEAGIPLIVRLLKPSNRLNVLAGVRVGWSGKLLEEDLYVKSIDSTIYWRLHFYQISPFVSIRYGHDLFVGGGIRMNYNFGYTWHYGQRLHDLTSSRASSSNSSLYNAKSYSQDGMINPITWTARFELGFKDSTFDLVAFIDWNIVPIFTKNAMRQMENDMPYSRIYEESTLSTLLDKKTLMGLGLNIYF